MNLCLYYPTEKEVYCFPEQAAHLNADGKPVSLTKIVGHLHSTARMFLLYSDRKKPPPPFSGSGLAF